MFNKHDIRRDAIQLYGKQAKTGYDWWWHSFSAISETTGQTKSFFIEFFLCNPALGEKEPVFGSSNPDGKAVKQPSYLMVKAGTWGKDARQLHRFFGWKQIEAGWGVPFHIQAADCYLDEKENRGSIQITADEAQEHPEWMCEDGFMTWDLKMEKVTAFNVGYGASTPFRKLQLFEMFWHAEGMKTRYSGWVEWNGERFLVEPETCYGYQDKNWGKNFTTPWVWLSSCNLTSEITGRKLQDSVFDIGGGRPKIGPIALHRKLLAAFWYEGVGYEFNFSKFWTGTRTKFDCHETETEVLWHVEQKTWFSKMMTDITCPKDEMLQIHYMAPDGSCRFHRLWNGGTGTGTVELWHKGKLVDRIHCENTGCEYGEYDVIHPYTS